MVLWLNAYFLSYGPITGRKLLFFGCFRPIIQLGKTLYVWFQGKICGAPPFDFIAQIERYTHQKSPEKNSGTWQVSHQMCIRRLGVVGGGGGRVFFLKRIRKCLKEFFKRFFRKLKILKEWLFEVIKNFRISRIFKRISLKEFGAVPRFLKESLKEFDDSFKNFGTWHRKIFACGALAMLNVFFKISDFV